MNLLVNNSSAGHLDHIYYDQGDGTWTSDEIEYMASNAVVGTGTLTIKANPAPQGAQDFYILVFTNASYPSGLIQAQSGDYTGAWLDITDYTNFNVYDADNVPTPILTLEDIAAQIAALSTQVAGLGDNEFANHQNTQQLITAYFQQYQNAFGTITSLPQLMWNFTGTGGRKLDANGNDLVATKVEQRVISETDGNLVLQAITDKIASTNPSLSGLTLAAIASAVLTAAASSPIPATIADKAEIQDALQILLTNSGYQTISDTVWNAEFRGLTSEAGDDIARRTRDNLAPELLAVLQLREQYTNARAALLDKLSVPGTLANTNNADQFKPTNQEIGQAAAIALLQTPANKLATNPDGSINRVLIAV